MKRKLRDQIKALDAQLAPSLATKGTIQLRITKR